MGTPRVPPAPGRLPPPPPAAKVGWVDYLRNVLVEARVDDEQMVAAPLGTEVVLERHHDRATGETVYLVVMLTPEDPPDLGEILKGDEEPEADD
jgi:hypothetical protein